MPYRSPSWLLLLVGFALALVTLQTEAAPSARRGLQSKRPATGPSRSFGAASASGGGSGSGGVVAWGSNAQGQTTVSADLWGVKGVAAGGAHTLGLRADGTVAGWGDNSAGQASPPAGLTMVKALAAGGAHSLALRANGTVAAWGDNSAGQASVPPGLSNVMAIAAGGRHSLALHADGTVTAWGADDAGQGATGAGVSGVMAIAAGRDHSLALKADGTVVAWGRNAENQCDVPAAAVNIKAIAAGGNHCLAVRTDGSVVAWGSNTEGQTSVPAEALGVFAVAAGEAHSVALRADGTVIAWGRMVEGQTTVPAGLDFVGAIAAGSAHTLAVRCTSSAVAWGEHVYSGSYLSVSATDFVRIKAISGGGYQSLALRADGRVSYRGFRTESNSASWTPPHWLEGVVAIASGRDHHLALLQDGQIAAWGQTSLQQTNVVQSPAGYRDTASGEVRGYGITGTGEVVTWGSNTANPPFSLPVRKLAGGDDQGIALLADGTVQTWGTVSGASVTPPAGLANVIAVAAGSDHFAALKADGTVVAWGRNSVGQTDTVGLTQVIGLAAARDHCSAIRANGTPVTWGGNASIRGVPGSLSGFSAVACGFAHSLAVIAKAPPVISSIPDQTMLEDQDVLVVPFRVSDADGPAASLNATFSSSVSGLVQDGPTYTLGADRSLRLVPYANAFGTTDITVHVTDGTATTSETFRLTILPVNDRPTFGGGGNQTVVEDSGPQFVNNWATNRSTGDANEFDQTLTFQVVSNSNPGLFSQAPEVNATTGALSYTPAPNAFGTATLGLVLKDSGGTANGGADTSTLRTFTITVTSVPDPVTITDLAVTTPEDTACPISLPTTDMDGAVVTQEILSQPLHGTLTGSGASRTYTPAANYHGPDSFTFRVNRSGTLSNTATVAIMVTPSNDAPSAQGQPVQAVEDTPRAITLVGSDVDGDSLTYQIVAEPARGVLQGSGAERTYVPEPDFAGTDSFQFRVHDSTVSSATATVSITVLPRNDAPVARDQSATTRKDTPLPLTLAGTDVDGDTLTYFRISGPAHGTLTGTGADRTYTPAPGYAGPDSFTYLVNDGLLDSNTATVTLTITPGNTAPVALDQAYSTPRGQTAAISFAAVDSDGDPLTYLVIDSPAHGVLSGSGSERTYTPDPGYTGEDTFTFRAFDGQLGSNLGTVTIDVLPVNASPGVYDFTVTTPEDTALIIDLQGFDPDGDSLTYFIPVGPAYGTLTGTGVQRTYTPGADFHGTDTFQYRATDGRADSEVGTVTIVVASRNDTPVALGQSLRTAEESLLAITLAGADPDSDPLTFRIVSLPAHGTLTGSGASRTYTPDPDFRGTDSFTFHTSDGTSSSALATVSIEVTPRNDAPTARGQDVTTLEDAAVPVVLEGSDVDGDSLTYFIVSSPSHGTLSGNGASRTYTPAPDYHGPDSFTFRVFDGTTESGSATVSLTVLARNDTPTGRTQAVTTPEDTPLAITLGGTDPDGDPLGYSIVSLPTHGTLSGSGANRTYTPDPNYHGPDSFTFTVADASGTSAPATVSITVASRNDAPTANSQARTTPEDTALSLTLAGADADGDSLTYEIVSGPQHGTLSGSGSNRSYTPAANYHGVDSITFRVSDGTATSAEAAVTLTVTPVADAPVPTADGPYAVTRDTTISLAAPGVLANDTDGDGDALSAEVVNNPAHGSVVLAANGSFTYAPRIGYAGADSFTYRVSDGSTTSAPVTVSLTVGSQYPASTAGVRVNTTGKVTIDGKSATIKVAVTVSVKGKPSGTASLTVPRGAMYKSTSVLSVVVAGTRARIHGKATGPNRSTVDFVIEVVDGGSSAASDRFRFDTSDGFSTGTLPLTRGSVVITRK